jgi:GntR family transcriptional regulator, transcriptional repressor for pyruvate dehydrogenase complex
MSAAGAAESVTTNGAARSGEGRSRRRIAQPRVAEMVADELRQQIIRGDLADGDLLPKLDDLLVRYPVSRPSIREAMRILETEGLVSVRRGKVGGAVVHSPTAEAAAYMVGLVMESQGLSLADLGQALAVLEPSCARLVAERDDAVTVAVPTLEAIQEQAAEHLDDLKAFTKLARRFHDELAALCPVRTLVLLVGVLEALWSAHADWAEQREIGSNAPTPEVCREVLRAHQQIIESIRAGESSRTERLVGQHLRVAQSFSIEMNELRPLSIINARSGLRATTGLFGLE